MALIGDYTDPYGGPRVARIPDWSTDYLVADLDLAGHQLLGLDINDLGFGAVAVHSCLAGPLSGPSAPPAFRVMQALEIGAQPHSTYLDALAAAGIIFSADEIDRTFNIQGSLLFTGDTIFSGGFSTEFIFVNNTAVTFPITGTLSTVDGLEALMNKSLNAISFETSKPGEVGLTLNDDLRVDGPVNFLDAFTAGGGPIVLTTLTEEGSTLTLPESGRVLVYNPDPGWNQWVGTGDQTSHQVSTATLAQCAAAIRSIIAGLIFAEVFQAA